MLSARRGQPGEPGVPGVGRGESLRLRLLVAVAGDEPIIAATAAGGGKFPCAPASNRAGLRPVAAAVIMLAATLRDALCIAGSYLLRT